MSNTYKFCGCCQCRVGMRCSRSKAKTKTVARSFRRSAKSALKKGKEPVSKVSMGYTD